MVYTLAEDRMAEAEVSLRLAFHLLFMPGAHSEVEVAIDGAQIRVHGNEVFPIQDFLRELGWRQVEQQGKNAWQGTYRQLGHQLRIHSRSGVGDVVTQVGAERIRAECKGGPLTKTPSSPEYRKLRGALGQVLTVEHRDNSDVLVVAVPHTPKFRSLADKWREAPLVKEVDIRIVLVGRDGTVEGLGIA